MTSYTTITTSGTGVDTLILDPALDYPYTTTAAATVPAGDTKGLTPPKDEDVRDGVMLALFPDPRAAAALVLPAGTTPADLHLTVAYLGKAGDIDAGALTAAARAVAAGTAPIGGQVAGHARFTGGEDGDVLVALFDSPALETLRYEVCQALTAAGLERNRAHGYTPHLTLGYLQPGDTAPLTRLPATPLTFTALSVVHGADRTDIPLTGHDTDPDGGPAALATKSAVNLGAFVVAGGRLGRVDLIVTGGQQVPGAAPLDDAPALDTPPLVGTKEHPAARVVEYAPAGDGTFTPTGNRFACPVGWLHHAAPLRTRQAKNLPEALGWTQVQLAEHTTGPLPGAAALRTVYERGVKSWPGAARTTLTAEQWGLGRVDAFAARWLGAGPAGYIGDEDLVG